MRQLYDGQQTPGQVDQQRPIGEWAIVLYGLSCASEEEATAKSESKRASPCSYVNRRPPTRIPFRPSTGEARGPTAAKNGNHNMAQGGRDRIPDMSNCWLELSSPTHAADEQAAKRAGGCGRRPLHAAAGSWNVDALWGYRSRPLAHWDGPHGRAAGMIRVYYGPGWW